MIARQSSGPKARVKFDCNGPSECERTDGGCSVPASAACTDGKVDENTVGYECFPSTHCAELEIKIVFPSCWDGESLTADDFMSHVAYAEGDWGKYNVDDRQNYAYSAECPASHPVRIPEIQLYFRINNYEGGNHLFADGGFEVHADYFSGWDEKELQKVLDECSNDSEAASSDAWCEQHFKFRDTPKKKGDDRIVEKLRELQPPAGLRNYQATVAAEAVTRVPVLPGSSGSSALIQPGTDWRSKPQCGLLGDKDQNGADPITNPDNTDGGDGGDGNGNGDGNGATPAPPASTCKDDYDDGSVSKPWADFVNCAAEQPYCQDEPATLLVHCAKTCGTCTDTAPVTEANPATDSNPAPGKECTTECNSRGVRGTRPLGFAAAAGIAVVLSGSIP